MAVGFLHPLLCGNDELGEAFRGSVRIYPAADGTRLDVRSGWSPVLRRDAVERRGSAERAIREVADLVRSSHRLKAAYEGTDTAPSRVYSISQQPRHRRKVFDRSPANFAPLAHGIIW